MENPERRHYPDSLKKIAIRLYTDGVEIVVMTRSVEVPDETVRSWIRAVGEKAKKIEERKKVFQNKAFNKPDWMRCGRMWKKGKRYMDMDCCI